VLKTPYDGSTTHVVLSPMAFIARLAALATKPGVNLTRFHGVFSPNSRLRRHVVPARPAEQEKQQKPSVRYRTDNRLPKARKWSA
jgi:hypothetical protein